MTITEGPQRIVDEVAPTFEVPARLVFAGTVWHQGENTPEDNTCDDLNLYCKHQEPHQHGFDCDRTCPCWDYPQPAPPTTEG